MLVGVHGTLRFESFLKAFRAHLLDMPCELRGDSYNAALTMIELMIWREDRYRGDCSRKADRLPPRYAVVTRERAEGGRAMALIE